VKIALLSGGLSLERSIALESGRRVADSLRELGHEVIRLDPGGELLGQLKGSGPDAAFIALHGRDGEDGTVQSLLELAGIPYTGPGVTGCRLSSDKGLAKHIFAMADVRTPAWIPISEAAIRDYGAAAGLPAAIERLGLPLIVKPASQGSALGLTVVTEPGDLASAVVTALSYGPSGLLERWIDGRELAVSVIDGRTLPPVEAIPTERPTYDFEARYEIGATKFEAPARLSAADGSAVEGIALAACRALGCLDLARVDMLLGPDGPTVLEVDPVPGLTETSLLPQAAEAGGLGFDQLVERILALALDEA
jgi:D-alanine-D-alanine ligase